MDFTFRKLTAHVLRHLPSWPPRCYAVRDEGVNLYLCRAANFTLHGKVPLEKDLAGYWVTRLPVVAIPWVKLSSSRAQPHLLQHRETGTLPPFLQARIPSSADLSAHGSSRSLGSLRAVAVSPLPCSLLPQRSLSCLTPPQAIFSKLNSHLALSSTEQRVAACRPLAHHYRAWGCIPQLTTQAGWSL